MDVDTAIQESIPWQEVKNRKASPVTAIVDNDSDNQTTKENSIEIPESTLKKVKVTINIRVPKDTEGFSPAKMHIETLHEIHKFDESAIFLNSEGAKQVNIEANIPAKQYKEIFKPMEKRIGRGPTSISISHDICITRKAAEIKEDIFPYLKKNKIFLYFNPKPGLEHFSAIGVLFGPNPDFTWRDSLADLLIDTMKAAITPEETDILGKTNDGTPKILLSLNIQKIGLSTKDETTSVALEIRVPTGAERIYTKIIERIYEKAENESMILPEKLGKFFPYYMKSKLPEVFVYLMRQQNADMTNSAVIPIFGYTPEARKQQITLEGQTTTVELALATTANIIRIEATPSTWNLHKYLVVVSKDHKENVQKSIKHIFQKIDGTLENQPESFPRPRCGGSEKAEAKAPVLAPPTEATTTPAYMANWEMLAQAQNPQDAGPTAPPKRHRRFTISYASAARAGIIKEKETENQQRGQTNSKQDNRTETNAENPNKGESKTQSSLSKSLNQSKIPNSSKDIDFELKALKENMERRMQKQDNQISEIVQVLKTMNEEFETRMTHVVLAALSREKEKVQEITHGASYDASQAPLADEQGNLPYGGKVQLGGPLDRLHHVEVTLQQMVNVLDTITDHMMEKDPSVKKLFITDDDSESEDLPPTENLGYARKEDDAYLNHFIDNDVQMKMIREVSGTKRSLGKHTTMSSNNNGTDSEIPLTPHRSPPTKREKPSNNTSANPDDDYVGERGEP
jgi:Holliday junction resolvase RusA-like endonuclease